MKPIMRGSLRPNATARSNGSASSAPPVYRPKAAGTAQTMAAPPVYRPGGDQTQAKPAPTQSALLVHHPAAGFASRPTPLQDKLGPIQPPASTRPPTCASTSLKPPTAAFAAPQAVQMNKHKNYTDQQKVLGKTVRGLPQLSPEYRGDEKKGVLLGARDFGLENAQTLGTTFGRTALAIERRNEPIGGRTMNRRDPTMAA
jgi:hypothetical protein